MDPGHSDHQEPTPAPGSPHDPIHPSEPHPSGPEEGVGDEHGHEAFLRYPIVQQRPFTTIKQAIDVAVGGSPEERDRRIDEVARLEEGFADLDGLVSLARRVLLGEADALEAMGQWIEEHGRNGLGEPISGGDPPSQPVTLGNEAPILDLFIGVAFAGLADDSRRGGNLGKVGAELLAHMGALERLHRNALDFLEGSVGPEELLGTLDLLDRGRPLPRFPSELEVCLGSLLDVLGRPDGALGGSMRHVQATVDPNTSRIAGVSPDPVCAGTTLTILADPSNRFDTSPPLGVKVLFSPCGVPGSDVVWDDERVTVTVPEQARTGQVYFGQPPEASTDLAEAALGEINQIMEGCPMFRGGGRSLGVVAYGQLPLSICSDTLVLAGARNALRVQHRPTINSFRAMDASNADVTGQEVEPGTQLNLDWRLRSDTAVSVRITSAGTQVFAGTGLSGRHPITATTTRTFTLEASNGCGPATARLTVLVKRRLALQPQEVSLLQGQSALLTVAMLQPEPTDVLVGVTSTQPQRVAVSGPTMRIPAGQTQASFQVSALAAGPPDHSVAAVIAVHAAGFEPDGTPVWVEPPQGGQRVVAFAPGTGTPSIDVIGVHAAMLASRKVLLFAHDQNDWAAIDKARSALWDPATGRVRSVPLARNLFCAGHCFLPDGRLLVAGGQSTAQRLAATIGSWLELHQLFGGIGADHDLHTFDPATERWTRRTPDMPGARWYPTCTTLPNGRALIVSGFSDHAQGTINEDMEVFDGTSNSVVTRRHFLSGVGLYPFIQVLPGGTLFAHSRDLTYLFSLDPTTSEPVIPQLAPVYRTRSPNTRTYDGQGSCVLLPLDPDLPNRVRLLVVGGGGAPDGQVNPSTPASRTAEIFDFDPSSGSLRGQAGWRFTTTTDAQGQQQQTFLTTPRFMADAVLLPDGTVAIVAGAGRGKADDSGVPVMWVESYDPESEMFIGMSALSVPRLYHSTALLLPDGSVLIAGSTGGRFHYTLGGGSADEFRLEVYHPPYLFRGPAPRIQLGGPRLRYGQAFTLRILSGDGTQIQRVAVLRAGSTTHTNNMDQRYVGLRVLSRTSSEVRVEGPADGTVAPPGPYLLFAIKVRGSQDVPANRIPSAGQMLLVGP